MPTPAKHARRRASGDAVDRPRGRSIDSCSDAARAEPPPAESERLRAQAEADLAPFRERMTSEAWTIAIEAAFDRLVREHAGLPSLPVE